MTPTRLPQNVIANENGVAIVPVNFIDPFPVKEKKFYWNAGLILQYQFSGNIPPGVPANGNVDGALCIFTLYDQLNGAGNPLVMGIGRTNGNGVCNIQEVISGADYNAAQSAQVCVSYDASALGIQCSFRAVQYGVEKVDGVLAATVGSGFGFFIWQVTF